MFHYLWCPSFLASFIRAVKLGSYRKMTYLGVTSSSLLRFLPQAEPVDEDEPSLLFSSPFLRGRSERPLVRPISDCLSEVSTNGDEVVF